MDEFTPITEDEALKEAIIQRIREEGPITFRNFMALALYHPQHGYYSSSREKMGREGDYLTSPEVSPIFGALVGKQLHRMWQVMGQPHPFDIVELGPGTGSLCRNALRWAARNAPAFFAALTYYLVEISQELAQRQRRTIQTIDHDLEKVRWLPMLEPDSVQGCILSNELVDSFPVHRLAVRGQLQEVYVFWDGQRFSELLRPPSTPAIEEYFQRLNLLPGEGCYAEVNLQALDWMAQVAGSLRAGFLLTLDYGDEAAQLYAPWRRDGTLLCSYRHSPNNDPYARLGRQDITSHVDFTSLAQAGAEAGLELVAILSQADYLTRLGIDKAMRPIAGKALGLEESLARRRAVMELIDPAGLGRIKVMIQTKNLGKSYLDSLL